MPEGRGPRVRAQAQAGVAGLAPAGFGLGLVERWRRLTGWLRACASEEAGQRRLFLWLPVFFGAGILLYFSASREPLWWAPASALFLMLVLSGALARNGAQSGARACLALAFLFAGFLTACLKTGWVAAPLIQRMMIAKTTAYVETIELRATGARLVMRPHAIAGLSKSQLPRKIRMTMRWRPQFAAGATITATLRRLPPPVASEPGGYDFAREAWFSGIGAVGNLVSRPVMVQPVTVAKQARLSAWIDRGRNWLTLRIISSIDGHLGGGQGTGAVAAALVTGKRGMIPETANEDLRAAGIYHVVSISGLHMVLAAGLFLWLMRAGFALFPGLALARPIKVWAALAAMVGASVYCLFSGAEVATQRSLIMTLIMLGAIVAGRPAISMRNLAIAALLVLVLDPNAILGPSFQMSFAAVAAMIAAFERRAGTQGAGDPLVVFQGNRDADRDPGDDIRADPLGRILLVLIVMAITTLVASLATDPYALYHFHRITPYGLLGNMMVLPLVEFIVMPSAVAGVLAAPFGLDGPVWWLMGQGVAFMMQAAQWVAGLQGSIILVPAFGSGALLLLSAGLIWLILWQTPIRWAGLAIIATGVMAAASTRPPDFLVSGQGRILAYRTSGGVLSVLNAKANRFGTAQWLASDADRRKPDAPGLAGAGRCDRSGCTGVLRDGRILALVLSRQAMTEDCGRADIVVTPLAASKICKGPELVIDRTWLRANGAARMFIQPDGTLRFETARTPFTDRPWARAPATVRLRPPAGQTSTGSGQASGAAKDGWTIPKQQPQ
jgi:competence protein ComEC